MNLNSIPPFSREGISKYVEQGRPMGGFLTYVFQNKFAEAVAKADDVNLHNLRNYALFLYNEAPRDCWGSEQKVAAWIREGGLIGKK